MHTTAPPDTTPAALLPLDAACRALGGISRSTLYELARAGRIELLKLGSRSFVPRASVDRLIAEMAPAELARPE